jgi:aromatic-L-amino-acid/L-tryptophan decarboxylase
VSDDLHWDLETFRRHGYEVVDWIADYLRGVEALPVRSQVKPGEILEQLPPDPPERPEPFADVLADVERVILPGVTHWQSPNFFAYFPANSTPPSILGELMSAGLGVQGMLWETSPAATELEMHVLEWLRMLLALPQRFSFRNGGGAVIQDSASSATLCALLAARQRAGAQRLAVYCSHQAHSSVAKAARVAGLPDDAVRLVATDADHAMDVQALRTAVEHDTAAGITPAFAVATVGTTGSTAVDPVRAIGEVCRTHGIWLHVDAALAGSAAVCPELRWLHDGVELADSYCVNPHKWLLVNFDCDAFWVADRQALVAALSILPEYLRNAATESGAVVDYRDWQIPLGRRFRALKLWFVIRTYGAEGLRRHIRQSVAWAQELAGWVRDDPRFELASPAPLNLVCLRSTAGDEVTQAVLERVNASGRAYVTHTRLDDRFVLRVAVGGTWTRREHVEALWRLLCETADEVTRVAS